MQRVELEGVGIVQRSKYIYAFKSFLKAISEEKEFEDLEVPDIENYLLSLRGYSPSTKNTRWVCIKKFLRYIGKKSLYEDIKPSFKDKGAKLPEEMLSEDDIKMMVESAHHIRDKAFISTLFESGARIGEALTRRLKHVSFDKYGAVLMLDGKTGMRRTRLIWSGPFLANWMDNHPLRDNPESWLWARQGDWENPIKYGLAHKVLRETAKRAGIKKRVHPHLFRHSRATVLAKDLTEQQLKVLFGWAGASKMASIYVHLSGKDVDNAILELNGVAPSGNLIDTPLRKKECPRCGASLTTSSKMCNKCGMVLKMKDAFDMSDNEPEFKDFLQDLFKKWKESRDGGQIKSDAPVTERRCYGEEV